MINAVFRNEQKEMIGTIPAPVSPINALMFLSLLTDCTPGKLGTDYEFCVMNKTANVVDLNKDIPPGRYFIRAKSPNTVPLRQSQYDYTLFPSEKLSSPESTPSSIEELNSTMQDLSLTPPRGKKM